MVWSLFLHGLVKAFPFLGLSSGTTARFTTGLRRSYTFRPLFRIAHTIDPWQNQYVLAGCSQSFARRRWNGSLSEAFECCGAYCWSLGGWGLWIGCNVAPGAGAEPYCANGAERSAAD